MRLPSSPLRREAGSAAANGLDPAASRIELPPNSRDPFVATVAAVLALACVLLAAGGDGRILELLAIGAAVLAAYAADWGSPRVLSVAAAAGYAAVELYNDRLTYEDYWTHILALGLAGVAVFAAATARRRREEQRRSFERALERIDEVRDEDVLERLLAGAKPLSSLERELQRSKRHEHAASMLLLRPDEIEDVALRHGQEGVQEVLRLVAETIGRGARASDYAYRHGAYDICVLLPETGAAGARVAAERFRLAISGLRTAFGPGDLLNLSVSIGAATFPSATSHEQLLASAHAALDRALELGGNRTVLSSLPENAPPGWALATGAEPAPTT